MVEQDKKRVEGKGKRSEEVNKKKTLKVKEEGNKKDKKENETKRGKGKVNMEEIKKLKKVPKHIKYLLLSEKAVDNINFLNTLVFIVDPRVNKQVIKREVEEAYEVKVKKVRTLIDRKGRKKAYVVLHPEYSAEELATQLGMM